MPGKLSSIETPASTSSQASNQAALGLSKAQTRAITNCYRSLIASRSAGDSHLQDESLAAEHQEVGCALLDIAARAAWSERWQQPAPPQLAQTSQLSDAERERIEALLTGISLEAFTDLAALLPALRSTKRKQLGAHYTPSKIAREIAQQVVELHATKSTAPRLLDPACGGGVFLIATLDELHHTSGLSRAELAAQAFGVDLDPLAVHATQLALTLWAGQPLAGLDQRVLCADALLDDPLYSQRFDLIVGNPPWVSYSGRHASSIAPAQLQRLRERWQTMREGWPALHAAFVELSASRLASDGCMGLLLPRQVCDLESYGVMRGLLRKRVDVATPCTAFGERVFAGVIEPCAAIIGKARATQSEDWITKPIATQESGSVKREYDSARHAISSIQSRLDARSDSTRVAKLSQDSLFTKLDALPKFASECFRDIGLHSGNSAKLIFVKGDKAPAKDWRPVLQGRDISPFACAQPTLWLDPNPTLEEKHYWRKASDESYQNTRIILRQTAARPIAALHRAGTIFRNSALACFGLESVDDLVLTAILNSELFAWLHQRRFADARQRTFPQVKISHLRALPAIPDAKSQPDLLSEIKQVATLQLAEPNRDDAPLSQLVCELYALPQAAREMIRSRAAA